MLLSKESASVTDKIKYDIIFLKDVISHCSPRLQGFFFFFIKTVKTPIL